MIHTNTAPLGRSTVDAQVPVETVHTGHHEGARDEIWRLPFEHYRTEPDVPFANLEPWYDGIRDSFRGEDQFFAYAASMLAGASAHAYGAHGIWNVGDGRFLAHWGAQTFEEARASSAPAALGRAHRLFVEKDLARARPELQLDDEGHLVEVRRRNHLGVARYVPGSGEILWRAH